MHLANWRVRGNNATGGAMRAALDNAERIGRRRRQLTHAQRWCLRLARQRLDLEYDLERVLSSKVSRGRGPDGFRKGTPLYLVQWRPFANGTARPPSWEKEADVLTYLDAGP